MGQINISWFPDFLISLEGSSVSNPMEVRCCTAPYKCMQHEYVLACIRHKLHCSVALTFHMRSWLFTFGSWQNHRSRESTFAWYQRRVRRYVVTSPTSTPLHSVAGRSRLVYSDISASHEALSVSELFAFNSSFRLNMNRCLFSLLARNCPFFTAIDVPPVNVTLCQNCHFTVFGVPCPSYYCRTKILLLLWHFCASMLHIQCTAIHWDTLNGCHAVEDKCTVFSRDMWWDAIWCQQRLITVATKLP